MYFSNVNAMSNVNNPIVVLQTNIGNIEIKLDINNAPLSAGNFLLYTEKGLYTGASFYRVVNTKNDNGSPVIEVIQGGIMAASKSLPSIKHEPTSQTGIKHLDGTISLARAAPGTGGGSAFFICVGAQPGLDFGNHRNKDGLGFAAFGRVIKGMDVVLKIHKSPTKSNGPSKYLRGQVLTNPVIIEKAFVKK